MWAAFLLPPRVWGARHDRRPDAGRGAVTPTCVGKTVVGIHWRSPRSCYPYTRGAHVGQSWTTCHASSLLPPHMWGAQGPSTSPRASPTCYPHGRGAPHGRLGLPGTGASVIPTHVGRTGWCRPTSRARACYPHTCGAHHRLTEPSGWVTLLPPHMWGAPFRGGRCSVVEPVTPTHVGRTLTDLVRWVAM